MGFYITDCLKGVCNNTLMQRIFMQLFPNIFLLKYLL